jgi:beta-exotoxin I transport system permease protein
MAAELFRRGLRDHDRALLGWCAGAAAYVLFLCAIFPSIGSSPDIEEVIQNLPEAVRGFFGLAAVDLTSGSGFVDTELFSIVLPLIAIALGIGSGARILAGEEESGRLELLLAYPLRRRRATLAKGAAVGVELVLLALVMLVALAASGVVFGLDLPFGRLVGGVAGVGLLGLLHGWLALALGAAVPNRGLAIGVASAFAGVGYLIGGLFSLASWLEPFRFLSSFWWIGQSPLSSGVTWWHLAVVASTALALLFAASLLFERRDVETP